MRKLIFILLGLIGNLICASGQSKIIISSNYAGVNSLSLQNIFDFTITNNSSTALYGSIHISLNDKNHTHDILYAELNNIQITPGLNSFISSLWNKHFFNNDLSKGFEAGTALYTGGYEVCIGVTGAIDGNIQSNICEEVNLSADFFVHLVTPFDDEEVETLTPILQWTSSPLADGARYHLMLAPLAPYHNAEDALRNNLKFLSLDLSDQQFFYPINAPSLQYGQKYAWQIAVVKNNSVVGLSEAWTFEPVSKIEIEKIKKDCYRVITRNFNNGNYLYGDVMKFAYENRTNETILNYSIKDITTGKSLKSAPKIKLQPGLNKVDLDLKKLERLQSKHEYLVEIRDNNNDKYKLTFNPYVKKQITE